MGVNVMRTTKYRVTCWLLTRAVSFSWVIARAATRLEDAGLWLDGYANQAAVRQGIDMLDVLSPLDDCLPVSRDS